MPLLTTTIGSYPKPTYTTTPDWSFQEGAGLYLPTKVEEALPDPDSPHYVEQLDRSVQQVILDQVGIGVHIPTDGKVRHEHYIHYCCRHFEGIDFDYLTEKVIRNGSCKVEVPTITGPILPGNHFLVRDWQMAQAVTDRPVKVTIAGPMTMMDEIANDYYPAERSLGVALAEAMNRELRALADAGCRWIQIDEPLFAHEPAKALSYGIEHLDRAFHGLPKRVKRAIHLCAGYPSGAGDEDRAKTEIALYPDLADALEQIDIDAISMEDARHTNDLKRLEYYPKKTIILGVIDAADTQVELIDDLIDRLRAALGHIDPHRLMVAPDCGLGQLDRETALAKLKNMCIAAESV